MIEYLKSFIWEPAPWWHSLFFWQRQPPWWHAWVPMVVAESITNMINDGVTEFLTTIAWLAVYWAMFVLLLAIGYVWFAVARWHRIFADRYGRECASCPSNRRRPEVPELPPQFRGCVHALGSNQVNAEKSQAAAEKAMRKCPFAGAAAAESPPTSIAADDESQNTAVAAAGKAPAEQSAGAKGKWKTVKKAFNHGSLSRRGSSRKTVMLSSGVYHKLSDNKADVLDMDHVYAPLMDFIWVMVFVYPNVIWLLISGYARLRFQQWMIESGKRDPPRVDYPALIAELMLEAPALAFLYRGMERQPNTTCSVEQH